MTRMHTQRKRSQEGFTLVELIITVVVFGILMTIAVPSFTEFMDSLRVKRAGDAVSAFLVNAKSEAIKRNATVRVIVQEADSGATWCLGMTTASTCDCLATPNTCLVDGADRVVASTSYKNITLDDPDDGHAFIFNPLRGTLPVGSNETVELESDNGIKLDVVVGNTGRIRMCSPDGSAGGYASCP